MPLTPDDVIDRRRLKRRLTFWRVVAVVAVVAAVIGAVGRAGGILERSYVGRIGVSGIIYDDKDLVEALTQAGGNNHVKALIVRINSPGGTVVGGEVLYRTLRAVAQQKPVVAVMGDTATSAAYMTALGTDYLVAREGSVTGSIGVLMQTADITGLLEKLGIKPESIKSRPLKAQPNPLEPMTPAAREATKSVILDLFDMFVDMVVERRNISREKALSLADGRIFTGRQALALGLVDALGGETEARKWLSDNRKVPLSLQIRDIEIKDGTRIWQEYLTKTFEKVLFSERLRVDGPISLWHPNL